MTKIHETLYIIHKCYINIQTVWEASQKHQQKVIKSVNHFTNNLAYYLILESVSFLDEYNKQFRPNNFDKDLQIRIRILKKVAKPILKRIGKWNLEKFRNNIIAHAWRDGETFVLPQSSKYNIPRSWLEFQILKDLIGYVHELIRLEFEIEMNESILMAESLKDNIQPKTTIKSANAETLTMVKELNILSKEIDRKYDLKIFVYENPANT